MKKVILAVMCVLCLVAGFESKASANGMVYGSSQAVTQGCTTGVTLHLYSAQTGEYLFDLNGVNLDQLAFFERDCEDIIKKNMRSYWSRANVWKTTKDKDIGDKLVQRPPFWKKIIEETYPERENLAKAVIIYLAKCQIIDLASRGELTSTKFAINFQGITGEDLHGFDIFLCQGGSNTGYDYGDKPNENLIQEVLDYYSGKNSK